MLFLLASAAWFAVLLFGVTMCRLAAHSDRAQTAAVAEWVTTTHFAGAVELPSEKRPERQFDRLHSPRRAIG